MTVERPRPPTRAAYRHFRTITTRWSDNDVYGHVNNVVYYSWFDSAVNAYLIEEGALDIHSGSVIGLVVHTQCHYFAPLAFPQAVTVGIRVGHRGRSSVRYEVAIFPDSADSADSADSKASTENRIETGPNVAAACGEFVHVYVDRATRRPTELPAPLVAALMAIEHPTVPAA